MESDCCGDLELCSRTEFTPAQNGVSPFQNEAGTEFDFCGDLELRSRTEFLRSGTKPERSLIPVVNSQTGVSPTQIDIYPIQDDVPRLGCPS